MHYIGICPGIESHVSDRNRKNVDRPITRGILNISEWRSGKVTLMHELFLFVDSWLV